MSPRIFYLDGLRGVLAVIVFVHHFFYIFYPEIIFGGSYSEFLSGGFSGNKLAAMTPLNIFFNPGFAIHFFFLLSGYVQTQHYFQKQDLRLIQKGLIKRYFRLAIPVLSVLVLVYLSHRLQLVRKDLIAKNPLNEGWVQSMLPNSLQLPQVFKEGLISCFQRNSRYYQILWTMSTELLNSYLVLFLALALHKLKHQNIILLSILVIQLFVLNEYYSAAFVTGMLIARLKMNSDLFNKYLQLLPVKSLCLLIGLYFGSYPFTGYEHSTEHSVYAPISFFDTYPHIISFYIGTSFLFCFLLYSNPLQVLLGKKIFRFLGEISFMFYLVHFVLLLTVTPVIYAAFKNSNLLVTGILSFAVVTAVSWILTILVDKPIIKLSNRFSDLFFVSKE